MSAASVMASTVPVHGAGPGSIPRAALQDYTVFKPKDLVVRPISHGTAKAMCVQRHYLGSYPGGALLNFGVFAGHALVGVAVFGVGPYNVHRYVTGAHRGQVVTLARLWLDDRCGRNSESRILGVICRLLTRWQETVKVIFEEFYEQGDAERKIGKEPIAMMDRQKSHELAQMQVGFMSGIVCPCYASLAPLLPVCADLTEKATCVTASSL